MIIKQKHYYFSQIPRIKITIYLGKIERKMKFWGKTKMNHNKMIPKKIIKSKFNIFKCLIIDNYQKAARNQDKFWV